MRIAPVHIVEEIRRIDPELRVRWSNQLRKFSIEKKINMRYRYLLPKPVVYIKDSNGKQVEKHCSLDSDRYICYRDGYVQVLSTPRLDTSIPHLLRMQDSARYGIKGTLQRLDEAERKKEELEKKQTRNILSDISGEAYDTLLVKQGERVLGVGGLRDTVN